ncbi:MAG: hypothetical protein RR651_04645, partial [Lysinibacillus sp.]
HRKDMRKQLSTLVKMHTIGGVSHA